MGHVFISYARADVTRARALADALHALQVPIWWDEALQLGEVFTEAICQKIDRASAVVVLWSRTSVRSGWVLREAERARQRRNLVPVLLDTVQPPPPFNVIDYAVLTAWRPNSQNAQFDKLLLKLIAITRRAGERPAPGKWHAKPLAKTKLLVQLDSETHVVEYQGPPKGCVYVDGRMVASGANANDQNRLFRFTLTDGMARYATELVVRVSMFRGDVKGMRLTVADRSLYQS